MFLSITKLIIIIISNISISISIIIMLAYNIYFFHKSKEQSLKITKKSKKLSFWFCKTIFENYLFLKIVLLRKFSGRLLIEGIIALHIQFYTI
jgi:hypothetical protein